MKLASSVESSIQHGFKLAHKNRHEFFTLEHLLWGAIQSPEMQEMLRAFEVNIEELSQDVLNKLVELDNTLAEGYSSPNMTQVVNRVLSRSGEMAFHQNTEVITLWMVLLNMLDEKDAFANYFLNTRGITALKIKTYASHGAHAFSNNTQNENVAGTTEGPPKSKSALETYGVNLNKRADDNKIDALIGRAYEIERTAQILSRRRKNNPLLVGEPGVGKTAIAEGLAKLIVDGDAPEALLDKKIWSLNVGTMLAGTKYRGDFEQRIKDVLDEVAKDENIVLFIDEIHTIIGAGSAGNNAMDASNIIKPALASGDLRVIGATTFQEYRDIFEKEKALDRRFQKIDVVEPTPSETVDILKGLKKTLEKHHGVKYTTNALQSAVDLSVKYITDRHLPDKAIDILDEAGAAERLKPAKVRHKFIDKDLIEDTISKITRIPVSHISQDEKDNLKTLEADMKGVVFGQNEAIEKLTASVCVAKAGLNDEEKPLGSFLFTGPTGVGKTEVARQLSKSLGVPLVRFDMSEYMESHSVARLIGSPPGYVGHEKGGLLTDEIFKNPHCVLLLDEMEKAHPDIYNILLQVMDRGALTDANGRTVNFKNTFIIMTSNAGATLAQRPSIGFVKSDHSTDSKKVLNNTFAPEFRNRIDAIVSFNPLGMNEICKIVDKNIKLLEKNLKDKNVTLDISDNAREQLAKEGFEPTMGARPMARLIQEKIKKPLAEKMLFGDLLDGGHAFIDYKDGQWSWKVSKMANPSNKKDEEVTKKKRVTRKSASKKVAKKNDEKDVESKNERKTAKKKIA